MGGMATLTDRARAEALDAADPLAAFRERFVVDDPELVYLDGNSLGRLPRATIERVRDVVEREWGGELVRGWSRWLDAPARVGDLLGQLIGAGPGQIVVTDSTTVNFHKVAAAALAARPNRRAIVTDRDNFPTDRYVLEGLAASTGRTIRWIEGDAVDGPQPADVAATLDDDVALVTLSLVNYRSAAIADLAAITALAHEAGALVAWDLSHAAGVIPVALDAADVDLAVGCTYKYLDGGPGAPAWLYVNRRHHGQLRSPIQGWFARRNQFEMDQGFEPVDGIRAWLAGTPGILGLAAAEEGIRLVAEAGIEAIRAKSVALTDYVVELHDAWLAPLGFQLGSPRASDRRGGHVAVRHPHARELCDALVASRVVPDFRAPDSIRLGPSPLSTSFLEVHTGMARLRELAAA